MERTTMTQPGQPVVFVSLTGDEKIKIYDIDAQTGTLSVRAANSAHGPSGALFLHPHLDVLYDAHVESSTLSSFQLDKTSGQLTHINQVDTGLETPAHLITDSAGRFLLTAYYGGGGITVHRLGSDGSIGEQLQHIDTGPKAHAVYMTPDDRFVFVPHVCPTNKTCQYRFNAETGLLTPNDPFELAPPDENTGPRHICFGPKGDVAYIINEQGNTATAHRFDGDKGTLERFQHLSTLPADHPQDGGATAHIEVHANGQWAYGSNRGHDSIVLFHIDPDGSLRPQGHYPVPASPRSFNIDPSGHYLYCAGEGADRMKAFRIDQSTGALAEFAEYEVGHKPFWVMTTLL
ncbi:MAG: 6-phosphogluconolactonase [Candidatus Latescibacterota bacterium]|jgi:6-phosphogluconolactonase